MKDFGKVELKATCSIRMEASSATASDSSAETSNDYCYCRQLEDGRTMIACDIFFCTIEWFHTVLENQVRT